MARGVGAVRRPGGGAQGSTENPGEPVRASQVNTPRAAEGALGARAPTQLV